MIGNGGRRSLGRYGWRLRDVLAGHRQVLRLGQELGQHAVAVAIDVVALGVSAWEAWKWRVCGLRVVVACPGLLTSRDFQFIANQIAVKIEVTVAVAIVKSRGIVVDGILAQVVVGDGGGGLKVARLGVKTLPVAQAVKRHLHIINHRRGACVGILQNHSPNATPFQSSAVYIDCCRVKSISQGIPTVGPSTAQTCSQIRATTCRCNVPPTQNQAIAIWRIDINHEVRGISKSRTDAVPRQVELNGRQIPCQFGGFRI